MYANNTNVFYKKRFWTDFFANAFLITALIISVFIMIFNFVYIGTEVKGESMQPTFNYKGGEKQDKIYINKFAKYDIGDIIVIKEHESKDYVDDYIIKRVIALGGDRVNILEDKNSDNTFYYYMTINGEIQFETYTLDAYLGESNNPGTKQQYVSFTNLKNNEDFRNMFINTSDHISQWELVVPENYVFALGDNRGNSNDSATLGPFKTTQVLGKVDHTIYYGQDVFKYFLNYFSPFEVDYNN